MILFKVWVLTELKKDVKGIPVDTEAICEFYIMWMMF